MIKKEKYNLVFLKATKPYNIKKKHLMAIVLIVVGACLFAMPAYAQKYTRKKAELVNKRLELQEKIKQTKIVLEENKRRQNTSQQTLQAISSQIKIREKVINTIGQQIFELALEIDGSKNEVEVLKADVVALKKEYVTNLLLAYKSQSAIDKIVFIFNSSSFNQATKRIKYLQQFNNYRRQQAQLILNTQKSIVLSINKMIAYKREKMFLAGIKEDEKKELEVDKKEETVLLTKLSSKGAELQKELSNNQISAKKLSQALSLLIAKEIEETRQREEARRKAEEEREAKQNAKNNTVLQKKEIKKPSADAIIISPEALKLSNDFVNNKGRLPWPVDNGYISEGFGTHGHATLKGVKTNNNGVNLTVRTGSQARAIFKGTVKAIFSVPGMEKVVLVNHGEYYSVYANLYNISVKIGDKIDTKQNLGQVYTNLEENKTEIHLEIYKQKQMLNPEIWLRN